MSLLCLPHTPSHSQPEPRSFREHRTVNTDVYELVLQKNGGFTVKDIRGTALFVNAAPYIYFAGQTKPRRLQAHASTGMRLQAHDPLGQGQGISLASRDVEWRVHSYPGKPYFSVRLRYRNSGRNPVVVAALSPWRSDPRADGAMVLGPASDTRKAMVASPDDVRMPFIGQGLLALRNAQTGRILIAGFLTHHRADTLLRVDFRLPETLPAPLTFSNERSETGKDAAPPSKAHLGFEAICVYDPPITVPSGGTLESEPLYLSVADSDAAEGLHRFGLAVAAMNALPRLKEPPTSGLFWPRPSESATVNPEELAEIVHFQATHLSSAGWKHFYFQEASASTSIQVVSEDYWSKARAAAVDHGIGLGTGLRLFAVPRRGYPQDVPQKWLLPLDASHNDAEGDTLAVTDFTSVNTNASFDHTAIRQALNPALPEVRAWLREQARIWVDTRGFSLLLLEDAHRIFQADPPNEWGMSRVEAYRLGLLAIREGMGNKGLLLVSHWHPAAIGLAHGCVQNPMDFADVTGPPRPYDVYQACLPPAFFARVSMPLHPPFSLQQEAPSRHDRQALLTQAVCAAFSGTALRVSVGKGLPDLQAMEPLLRLAPSLRHVEAWSVSSPPAVFPIMRATCATPGGTWHLVACVNPSGKERSVLRLDSNALNIGNGPFTFYEYLPRIYHGLLSESIDIALEPAETRLFCLRPYRGFPVLLAYDRHVTLSGSIERRVAWDKGAGTLSGSFAAVPDHYRLVFLVPSPYRFRQADVSGLTPAMTFPAPEIVVMEFTVAVPQELSWRLHFDPS